MALALFGFFLNLVSTILSTLLYLCKIEPGPICQLCPFLNKDTLCQDPHSGNYVYPGDALLWLPDTHLLLSFSNVCPRMASVF